MRVFSSLVIALYSMTAGAEAPAANAKPVLFDDGSLLELAVEFDFRRLQGEKAELRETGVPGLVQVGSRSLAVRIMPRGNVSFSCQHPQLKLDFKEAKTQETVFEGLKKVKLFTKGFCLETKTDPEQDKQILSNYLTYKLLEQMSPWSFKTRLARISYTDLSGSIAKYSQLAFFLEPTDAFAQRLLVKPVKKTELVSLGGKLQELMDSKSMSRANAFEFFISNFDYGIPGHFSHILNQSGSAGFSSEGKNVEMFKSAEGKLIPVIYDFDFSRFAYFMPQCFFALRFFQDAGGNGSCAVSSLAETLKSDLDRFHYKRDAVENASAFVAALRKWQKLYRAEIDKLGVEYSTGAKAYTDGVSTAFNTP